jgi:septal ring-binding cell division protein DamX
MAIAVVGTINARVAPVAAMRVAIETAMRVRANRGISAMPPVPAATADAVDKTATTDEETNSPVREVSSNNASVRRVTPQAAHNKAAAHKPVSRSPIHGRLMSSSATCRFQCRPRLSPVIN